MLAGCVPLAIYLYTILYRYANIYSATPVCPAILYNKYISLQHMI